MSCTICDSVCVGSFCSEKCEQRAQAIIDREREIDAIAQSSRTMLLLLEHPEPQATTCNPEMTIRELEEELKWELAVKRDGQVFRVVNKSAKLGAFEGQVFCRYYPPVVHLATTTAARATVPTVLGPPPMQKQPFPTGKPPAGFAPMAKATFPSAFPPPSTGGRGGFLINMPED